MVVLDSMLIGGTDMKHVTTFIAEHSRHGTVVEATISKRGAGYFVMLKTEFPGDKVIKDDNGETRGNLDPYFAGR